MKLSTVDTFFESDIMGVNITRTNIFAHKYKEETPLVMFGSFFFTPKQPIRAISTSLKTWTAH